ncbi:MAG: hypothetical protein KJ597_02475 [Nanoarchaeota archaeon]|nr:hypothetical protein [Nanoarchaeota archaeon]MBU1622415.1 hypothetical protein [Nanoarchaeota archaeon]
MNRLDKLILELEDRVDMALPTAKKAAIIRHDGLIGYCIDIHNLKRAKASELFEKLTESLVQFNIQPYVSNVETPLGFKIKRNGRGCLATAEYVDQVFGIVNFRILQNQNTTDIEVQLYNNIYLVSANPRLKVKKMKG